MATIHITLLSNQPIIQFAVNAIIANHKDLLLVPDIHTNQDLYTNATNQVDIILLARDDDVTSFKRSCLTLWESHPQARIIALVEKIDDLQELLTLELAGCICKDELNESLVHIIRSVAAGAKIFSQAVVEQLTTVAQNFNLNDAVVGLTESEGTMLALMIKGYTNEQISDELCLSPQTVRNKSSTIYSKVGVESRPALLAWAYEQKFMN